MRAISTYSGVQTEVESATNALTRGTELEQWLVGADGRPGRGARGGVPPQQEPQGLLERSLLPRGGQEEGSGSPALSFWACRRLS